MSARIQISKKRSACVITSTANRYSMQRVKSHEAGEGQANDQKGTAVSVRRRVLARNT